VVNPVTVNLGIIVPLTGADVDTWGAVDVNPNMVAIDGLIGGVQTIGVTNVPITLTAPVGFVATPSPGPTQSQNRVLRFTGVMSADVRVTLPLPGVYVIDNRCTGINFALTLQGATPTEVLGIPQGSCSEVYNDGANVRPVNWGRSGKMEFWGAITAMPSWVTQSTVKPYLWCDGTIYNAVDFPGLFNQYGGNFGGNGITTFGVQDLSGRVPLAYDKTGARITVAGCGINGQTMGAAQDKQTNILVTANLPPYTPSGTINNVIGGGTGIGTPGSVVGVGGTATGGVLAPPTVTSSFNGVPQGGTSTPVNNVQPVLVTGIWVVKT
jgi:microcystin-dependent protein